MRAYQRSLFDESLTLVPRFQIGRTIRVITTDWPEDNGKEGEIKDSSAYEDDIVYIVNIDGEIEVFYEREVTGV